MPTLASEPLRLLPLTRPVSRSLAFTTICRGSPATTPYAVLVTTGFNS